MRSGNEILGPYEAVPRQLELEEEQRPGGDSQMVPVGNHAEICEIDFNLEDHLPLNVVSFLLKHGHKLEGATRRLAWDYSCFKVSRLNQEDHVGSRMAILANEVASLDCWKTLINQFGESCIARLNEQQGAIDLVANSCQKEFYDMKENLVIREEKATTWARTLRELIISVKEVESRLSKVECALSAGRVERNLQNLQEETESELKTLSGRLGIQKSEGREMIGRMSDQQEGQQSQVAAMIGQIQNRVESLERSIANIGARSL